MTDLERIEYRIERIEQTLKETHKAGGWITLREAVEYTGLSDSTLRRLVYDGKLTCSRKSGKLLFKTSWIDKFLIYGKQRLSAKERRQLQELSL
jgi:excisionase family DNA binding protein